MYGRCCEGRLTLDARRSTLETRYGRFHSGLVLVAVMFRAAMRAAWLESSRTLRNPRASSVKRQASSLSRFAALLVICMSPTAFAESLTLSDAWVRAVPPVSSTTAGYFILENSSEEAVTLTGFETAIAGAGELHEMAEQPDGTRRMRRLGDVKVPAGEQAAFRPGGKHLMLFRLVDPLQVGDSHELCLTFAGRAPLCAEFEVR